MHCPGNSLEIYQEMWNVGHTCEVYMAYNHVTESVMTNMKPVMSSWLYKSTLCWSGNPRKIPYSAAHHRIEKYMIAPPPPPRGVRCVRRAWKPIENPELDQGSFRCYGALKDKNLAVQVAHPRPSTSTPPPGGCLKKLLICMAA